MRTTTSGSDGTTTTYGRSPLRTDLLRVDAIGVEPRHEQTVWLVAPEAMRISRSGRSTAPTVSKASATIAVRLIRGIIAHRRSSTAPQDGSSGCLPEGDSFVVWVRPALAQPRRRMAMQYALLIYADEATGLPEQLPADAIEKFRLEAQAVIEDMKRAGVFVSSLRLTTAATAATQRVLDNVLRTTDGPFAETKEVLGGLILIECASRDEALAWAARVPMVRLGSIEVRPVRACG